MILITSGAAKAVDLLKGEEIGYYLIPAEDEDYPHRHSDRKMSIDRIYNKFAFMSNDPWEGHTISLLPNVVEIQRINKRNKWVFPMKGILNTFSASQIYYLFGEGTVVWTLEEVTDFMHETNKRYGTDYTCPIFYASCHDHVIQL